MSLLGSVAAASNTLQVGGAAVGLLGVTKALLSSKPNGINGILFDIPETEDVQFVAQITDHFTEENFAVQDHVAFSPVRITLTGKVSELVYKKSAIEEFVSQALDRLGPLGVLSPGLATKSQQYLSEANRLKSAASSALTQAATLSNAIGISDFETSNQKSIYKKLKGIFENRSYDPNSESFITVETPWETFDDMIIENLSFSQDETTKDVTSIQVVLKQLRIIQTQIIQGTLKGRVIAPAATPIDKGPAKGKDDGSFLSNLSAASKK